MSDKLWGGVRAGSVSVSLPVVLRKTADNTEQTGKVFGDVTGSYWRQGGVRTAVTMATLAGPSAAYSSGGFVEVDAVNQPGLYRFDVPDAALGTGADWVVISLKVASTYVYHERVNLEDPNVSANRVADQTLRRTYANARVSANGDAVNFRSLLGAVGKAVNKTSIAGSTLSVFQEDDATSTAPGGTQAVTTDAAANPIVGLDTA